MYSSNERSTVFKVHRGFSLVELMVTIGIIAIITAIVVIKYGAFNSSVLLKSQAYEMALNIRETQVFAISVRGESGGFRDPYGLYFTTSSPNQYRLFIDGNENGRYNTGEEIGEPYIIDGRFQIAAIKPTGSCTSSSNVNNLSITFQRPDFDAHIAHSGATGLTGSCIVIASVTDSSATRAVEVSTTGQITVE